MESNEKHNSFIFNEKIDSNWLNSLYESDYPYMEEIFSITLSQLGPDIPGAVKLFELGDLQALQRAVHKLKPSFSFVGLPDLEAKCKRFETACSPDTSPDAIKKDWQQLLQEMQAAEQLIGQEWQRLKEYNRSAR